MSGEIVSATFASVSRRDRTMIFNCFSSAIVNVMLTLCFRYDASSFLITMRYIMAHPNENFLCMICDGLKSSKESLGIRWGAEEVSAQVRNGSPFTPQHE